MESLPASFKSLRKRSARGYRSAARYSRQRAFTLTELMIALVLVLLLVLAVSQIFNVTVKTIGKGNATGEVVRGLDAMRMALQIDFAGTDDIAYAGFTDETGILPADRQPAIIISSTSVPAFMNKADADADLDATARTFDVNLDGDETDPNDDLLPYEIGRRWFRLDSLSFVTKGDWESQTNLGGTGYYGGTTSKEAWVWYGHARVYNGEGDLTSENDLPSFSSFPGPGAAGLNPNNQFASQFTLVRNALLLRPQTDHDQDSATSATVVDDTGAAVTHLRPRWDTFAPETDLYYLEKDGSRPVPNLGPFTFDLFDMEDPPWPVLPVPDSGQSPVRRFAAGSYATFPQPFEHDHAFEPFGSRMYVVQDARVDVAGLSSGALRERIGAIQILDATGSPSGATNGPLRFGLSGNGSTIISSPETWYDRMFARSPGKANAFRFFVNPFILKPLDAGEVSQASNYLLGGATQFIVEYAGDFLTQDADGANTANAPDGVLDFTIDVNGVRHIRWYGMPRDVDGDGVIYGPAADALDLIQNVDVRPLADYTGTAGPITIDTGFPFEKRLPAEYTGDPETMQSRATIEDYLDLDLDPDVFADPFDWTYLAAWGPGDFDGDLYPNTTHDYAALAGLPLRPSLIRVIVQGIDKGTKLEEPLGMELVFRVPAE